MKQEFNNHGLHRLVDEETGETTQWAVYSAWTYLKGKVGVTDYFTMAGEKILTPQEFVELGGIGQWRDR